MPGETDLRTLLKSVSPVLYANDFVFCSISEDILKRLDIEPFCTIWENEGITAIVPRQVAEKAGLSYEYVSRMIELSVHSSLNAVGFIAAVSSKLAEQGISVNPVSACCHDYLFVPADRAEDAMRVLEKLSDG